MTVIRRKPGENILRTFTKNRNSDNSGWLEILSYVLTGIRLLRSVSASIGEGGNRMIISVASLLEIRFPCQIVLRIDLPGPMGIFFTYHALYTSTYLSLTLRIVPVWQLSVPLVWFAQVQTLIRDVAYSHSTFNAKRDGLDFQLRTCIRQIKLIFK